jgi:hypothetical protein
MTSSKNQYPDYMDTLVTSSRNAFCDALHNPSLWSEKIVQQTLARRGGAPFDIEDAQSIIQDYLTVLSEDVRRGKAK